MADGAYQHAKKVAVLISGNPGVSARELYRLYGERFAEFGCDGSTASAMIGQHLAKFESDGLVVSERSGRKQTDARKWTWIGPKPMEQEGIFSPVKDEKIPVKPQKEPAEENYTKPCDTDNEVHSEELSDIGSLSCEQDDVKNECVTVTDISGDPAVNITQYPKVMHGLENSVSSSIKPGDVILDHEDLFDSMLIEIRKLRQSRNIQFLDEKVSALEKLAEITSPDISEMLVSIASDIKSI